jgi:hypothetical protein
LVWLTTCFGVRSNAGSLVNADLRPRRRDTTGTPIAALRKRAPRATLVFGR